MFEMFQFFNHNFNFIFLIYTFMWKYNNVRFIYTNEVDSVYHQSTSVPYVMTYIKSKFALMEALRVQVESSYLGSFAEIDPRTVKHDPPIKV